MNLYSLESIFERLASKTKLVKGKLYRIIPGPQTEVEIYGSNRTSYVRPTEGAVILYLGYVPPVGKSLPLYHVICDDVIGWMSTSFKLERLTQ